MEFYVKSNQPAQVLWYWQWISDYLWDRGRYPEYIQCDRYALAAAEQLATVDLIESQRKQATISAELAYAHMEVGELEAAERYVREAERLWRQLADPVAVARVLRYQATLLIHRGDYSAAETLCQQAFAVLDEAEQRHTQTQPLSQHAVDASAVAAYALPNSDRFPRGPIHALLGTIYVARREYTAARRELLAALRVLRSLDDPKAKRYWSLGILSTLGYLYSQQSKSDKARRYYRRCIALTEDSTNLSARAEALFQLARLDAQDGAIESARCQAQAALRLYERMGKYRDKTRAVRFLAALEHES